MPQEIGLSIVLPPLFCLHNKFTIIRELCQLWILDVRVLGEFRTSEKNFAAATAVFQLFAAALDVFRRF